MRCYFVVGTRSRSTTTRDSLAPGAWMLSALQNPVGNSTVSPCSSAKYLGLTIDNRLTFSRHIDLLVGKIAGKLKTFQRVRNSLDSRARRSFYISLIQTSLLYGSNAFSPCLSITCEQTYHNLKASPTYFLWLSPFSPHCPYLCTPQPYPP